MANTDKNIVITPNNGSESNPNIVFSGANASTGPQNITLTVTPNNSGTVAFSGSAGQLLAINNDIANTLSTGGTISATGNITANNFVGNLVGNVTGNFSGSLANGNSNISIPAANGNVNISAVGNANIVVVTGTGANIAGTLSVSGNANSANLTTGNISSTGNITTGDGTGGTITGANLVSANFFTGTLTTAAQPNITSVGTLSSLSVSGNITAGNLIGIFANGNSNISIPAANGNINISAGGTPNELVITSTGINIAGTLNATGNANVGNLGTAGLITATGNITGNFFIGNGSQLTGVAAGTATIAQTVTTNAQPNITSVGTLTSLSVSGTSNLGVVNGTDASFIGNAIITGNLFVNGNLTYLNVETVAVEDPIIQLQTGANGAAPIANSGKDVGTALNYYDTAAKIAFMGWDVSNAEIAFGSNVSITNEVVTFTSLANTRSGNTLTTGVFATTLSATGNANVGNLGTAGLITATGNITGGNLITGGLLSVTGAVTASSYTAANSLAGYTLANTGTAVGKIFENGNIIKLEATSATYGVALAANGTVMLSFDANGYGAIGSSSGTTGYALRIAKQTTGATTAGSILINPTVQTDVTSLATGVRTSLSTAAGASPYTITNLVGYATYGGTIGANTTVTNQIAYYVDASANTGATNYGFYGGLASAASTFNLYMTGTANNYLGGSLGLGATSLTGYTFRNLLPITGASTSYQNQSGGVVQSDVTQAVYNSTTAGTAAASFALTSLYHYQVNQGTIGAGSSVTNQYGFNVTSSMVGATNNYGYSLDYNELAGRWGLYFAGSAQNYINGSLGLGSTSVGLTTGIIFRVSRPLTGSTSAFGILSDGIIQSGVTTNAVLNRSVGQTQAATFTLTNLIYNQAVQGTFGLNSVVTTQSGFVADNTLIGATNNYGFRGSIASGANRFNLYMDGTANNYSAGNFGIGTTTPAVALHVKQNGGAINVEGTDQAYIQFYPRGMATRTSYIGVGSAGSNNFTIRNDDNGQLQLQSGNSNVTVFANGNVTTTVAGVANVVVVTGTGANIAGTLSATGNITGNFFIGNGSQLTGITTATSFANGNSNVNIPAANGNVNISAVGNANILVVTGTGANITGTLSVSGNANIANIGTAGLITATGNIGGGNLNTTGVVSASRLISTVATGTAPLTVTSTTRVSNLNVAYSNVADFIGAGVASSGNFNITLQSGTTGNIQPLGNTAFIANASNGALYATTFVGALSGAATSATTAGTVTTAAQPNITSVGTLTSLSVSGNITGGNLIGIFANGNSSISIPAANGNINISAAGSPNEIVITSTGINVAGTLNATGNANVGNLGTTTAVITTGNITTINSGLLQNGNSNVSITANANVAIAVTGANRLVVTSTGANLTGTLNISGNTTFSGTGQRIFGDFSNATFASRTAFQDKTTNNLTVIPVLPNGTNVNSGIAAFNSSDPGNSAYGIMSIDDTKFQVGTTKIGTGTYLPMTFSVGGSDVARFDTGGNLLVGTTNANGANNITSTIIGGIHQTIKGQVTPASGVATTLFTIPSLSFSTWMVTVQLAAGDTANYSAWAMIAAQTSSVRIMTNVAGTLLTISNSGLAIQATQSSGTSSTIFYSAMRIM